MRSQMIQASRAHPRCARCGSPTKPGRPFCSDACQELEEAEHWARLAEAEAERLDLAFYRQED